MRRVHIWAGLVTVLAFLISGQMLRHHQPPTAMLSDSARLMLRSRHIYLLASGLVNLMLGLYVVKMTGWRGAVQMVGSVLVTISPVLLVAAFLVEPDRGFQTGEIWWSSLGLYVLFGGAMHAFGGGSGWAKRIRRLRNHSIGILISR